MKEPRSRAPHSAFTILEILIAVTIFAITVSALFVTFRTGIRAWAAGHSGSEIFQTARIAQDVIIRDLHNVAFKTEFQYNNSFRNQVQEIGMRRRREAERLLNPDLFPTTEVDSEVEEPASLLSLETIASPIDLSLSGEDGGLLDTISFARHQRPRSTGEVAAWGVARVKYYVAEGVLYREEGGPFGFRPGERLQKYYEIRPDSSDVAKLFYGRSDSTERRLATPFEDPALYESDIDSLLPKTPLTAEPLCEGVVIFNITYGYYRFDQWNEADSWDSSLFQYRFPSNERFIADIPDGAGGLATDVPPRQETGFNPLRPRVQMARVGEETIAFTPAPDNLPGYIAIQLGLRDPITMGRIRSFTFFVSLPMAQEQFDTTLADELNVTRRRP